MCSFKWNLCCIGFVKDLVNEGASHQPAQSQGRKKNLNVQHAAASTQSTTELLKWVCTKSWFSSKTSEEILDEVGSERDEAYLSGWVLCWRSLSAVLCFNGALEITTLYMTIYAWEVCLMVHKVWGSYYMSMSGTIGAHCSCSVDATTLILYQPRTVLGSWAFSVAVHSSGTHCSVLCILLIQQRHWGLNLYLPDLWFCWPISFLPDFSKTVQFSMLFHWRLLPIRWSIVLLW